MNFGCFYFHNPFISHFPVSLCEGEGVCEDVRESLACVTHVLEGYKCVKEGLERVFGCKLYLHGLLL